MILQLERLLKLSIKSKGIIQKNNYESDLKGFFGREEELNELEELLGSNNSVLIYGMGGIGKSEFVKQFLTCHSEKFDKVIYIEETGADMKETVINDDNLEIDGLRKLPDVSGEEYFDHKIELVKEEYQDMKNQQKELVLVFDNTEYFTDLKAIKKIKSIGCKIIIISREVFHGLPVDQKMEIGRIRNKDAALEMFLFYYESSGLNMEEIKAVREMIDYYDGHVLLLELMAKEESLNVTIKWEDWEEPCSI